MTVSEPRRSAEHVADEASESNAGLDAGARRIARNAAILAAAEIAGKFATLAFTIVAARALGPVDFGAFAYAVSFSLLVAVLPAWGFDSLLIQRASAEPGRLPAFLSETLVWRAILAIPVFIVSAGVGLALRPTTRSAIALLLVLAATFLDVFVEAGRSAARACQSQGGIGRALVVQRFTTAIFAVGALWAGLGLVGVSVAYLAGTVAGGVIVLRNLRRLGVSVDFAEIGRAGLARTGRLSVPIGIDAVLALALFRIDQLMLGAFKGDAAVGQYAAGYRLLETVLFVSWSVGLALFPAMSAAPERWHVRRYLEQGLAGIFAIYVPFAIGLWIEAESVLDLLFGPVYAAQGASLVRWLSSAPFFFAIGFLGSYALLATGRPVKAIIATILATVYNVGLNLALIPRLSGTGAAIATTTSYALEALIVLAFLVPAIGVVRLHRSFLPPALATAVMAALLIALHQPILIELVLAVLVYGLAWLTLARWWAPGHLAVVTSLVPWRR
jgi:O-antigen/teichoic acid export membrane protein